MPKRRWLGSMRDDIRGKGLLGEGIYNRATWRSISSKWDLNPCICELVSVLWHFVALRFPTTSCSAM